MKIQPHNKWQIGVYLQKDWNQMDKGWRDFGIWFLRFTDEESHRYEGDRVSAIPHEGFFWKVSIFLPLDW